MWKILPLRKLQAKILFICILYPLILLGGEGGLVQNGPVSTRFVVEKHPTRFKTNRNWMVDET